MEPSKTQSSLLFVHSAVDVRDDFEEKYERAYKHLQTTTAGLNDKEFHDIITTLVCKDKQHEDDVSVGMIYVILTDPALAPKTYRDLTLLSRDGLQCVTNNLVALVVEKYPKLTEVARKQLFWLLREFVKNQVPTIEPLLWNMLRQASGGDVSAKNIVLIEGLLDIFIEHRVWLEKQPFLVGVVVYTYVRLLEDHGAAVFTALRNKEVKFIISLIRDRFADIMPLGRDFVRLLQNVAKIPEFEQLWRDILLNPKSLCSTFQGIWQLLQTRTSRRFMQCRLTPDIERKMHFFASSVKFGNHKRYQDWFQDRYFNTPESHSLRSDLIRYIVNAIHPTNDMLCSDIIPRWAIIGWLLTSCTSPVSQANAKLALFYDWLFFDPLKDNIMNVEPGILVMYHSIRTYPLVSTTCLDFLCRIMRNFYPKGEERIRGGVYNSLNKILEKQVIPNLQPLFESPKLDRDLKQLIRDNFREYCSPLSTDLNSFGAPVPAGDDKTGLFNQHLEEPRMAQQIALHLPASLKKDADVNDKGGDHTTTGEGSSSSTVSSIIGSTSGVTNSFLLSTLATGAGTDPKFSDEDDEEVEKAVVKVGTVKEKAAIKHEDDTDDDDLPLSKVSQKVRLKDKSLPPTIAKIELPATLRDPFEKFLSTKSSNDLESFLIELRTCAQPLESEQEQYIHSHIINLFKVTLQKPHNTTAVTSTPTNTSNNTNNNNNSSSSSSSNNGRKSTSATPTPLPLITSSSATAPPNLTIFPESKNDEKLSESIQYPIFVLFKLLYQYEEKCKKCLVELLVQCYQRLPSTGYLLLYFLKVYAKLQSRKNQNSTLVFKTNVYKMLCDSGSDASTPKKQLDQCLAHDLALLEKYSAQMFLWLLPDIYREFDNLMVNNSEVVRILVGCVDARNLRDIIYSVTQGKLVIFKNDGVLDVVRHSLCYETFEQFCLWQLVQAHDVPIEYLQDILPELESSNHSEALTYMLLLLKNEKPTAEMTRLLLSRETKNRGDPFVTSALRYWCQEYEEKLSEIIASLLTSKYPTNSPNKRKRPLKGSAQLNSLPTSEQLLNHLEHFRRSCRHGKGTGTGLYVQDAMQRALQQAFSYSTDSLKKQFSDLFALAAEDETTGTVSRRGTSSRGRKQAPNKKDSNSTSNNSSSKKNSEPVNNAYSSEESSDEDWSKQKTAKRRKKAISDSD